MAEYKIISSDSHVIEPEDLWEKRIDKTFRDRAPRLFHGGDTDQWVCDGMRFGVIGVNQQAGVRFEDPSKLTMEGSMDTARLGGLDPTAHVNDMDLDGIAAGVLYPSQGLTLFGIPATDVLSASFRAYNDYLAEFCSPYPDRLKGIAMINVDDMEEGTAELERAAKIGLAGAMISIDPVLPYHHAAYDRFWATAQDLKLPLSLHTGTMRWKPGMDTTAITLETGFGFSNREYNPRECVDSMIFAGVFERFPKLKVGVIEFEIAWAPYFINQMDDYYKQRPIGVQLPRFKNNMLPSDFFRSNIFISFQEDDLGIQLRHHIGVNTLLWGSDYPHAESTFPKSREILGQILSGVPEDEQAQIAGDNTAKLYGFD